MCASAILPVEIGSSWVTSVCGSCAPCSNSTSMPARNCSRSKRDQSTPISSPTRFASSVLVRRSSVTALSFLIEPGAGEHPSQVDDHLRVDVLLARRLEDQGLPAERDTELAVVLLLSTECVEQRLRLPPLDVAGRRMAQDLLERGAVISGQLGHECSVGRMSACVRADEAVREREHHELGTGLQLELAHDVRAVRVHGADGDEEPLADLLIRVTEGEQMNVVPLSLGKRLQRG